MSGSQPNRSRLPQQRFDAVVIGGGINGVAIARELALASKSTLLIEQHDFASGTTSRSTRLIHGGLRYLEHGEIGLVRESLRERERLLREKPHLVRPLSFVLALPKDGNPLHLRSALAVRAGLWLYRRLGGSIKPARRNAFESALDSGTRLNLFHYEDAQCEFPERLVAEWLREAVAAGATALNYCRALELQRRNGQVTGLLLRDQLTGEEAEVHAFHFVNATGPWADELLRASAVEREPMVGGVRGSHIVLPHFPGAPDSAVYTEAPDRRPVFVLPWNGQVLVGTTEVQHRGDPGQCQASADEVAYLFRHFERLFPESGLDFSDVRYSYSGVRPLPFSPGETSSAITRRHVIHDHTAEGLAGLISVVGGKLTTAAAVARDCARMMRVTVPEPHSVLVAEGRASGVCSAITQWAWHVAQVFPQITPAGAQAIAEWHGRNALAIIRCARSSEVLAETICPHTPHIVAEALCAFRQELAVTLADVLLRRVPLAFSACWSGECSRIAARRIGRAMGWSELRTAAELAQFEAERDRFLQRPPVPAASLLHQHATLPSRQAS